MGPLSWASPRGWVTAASLALALSGCAGGATSRLAAKGPFTHGSGRVIAHEQLRGQSDLLGALHNTVPNIRVRQTQQCPEITLRGVRSAIAPSPLVYLDGQRAANTCLLEHLRGDDVQRIEVYPLGTTSRPGYATHTGGLILIFSMRGSDMDPE